MCTEKEKGIKYNRQQAKLCIRQTWFDLRQGLMIDNLNGHSGSRV
jgi:hypothetical protein